MAGMECLLLTHQQTLVLFPKEDPMKLNPWDSAGLQAAPALAFPLVSFPVTDSSPASFGSPPPSKARKAEAGSQQKRAE